LTFVVNVCLGDTEATEANGVVHPSKLSEKLFGEKHPHIQQYLNTLAGGIAYVIYANSIVVFQTDESRL
jgi:hypothetical protein